jgi:hypothetical protein
MKIRIYASKDDIMGVVSFATKVEVEEDKIVVDFSNGETISFPRTPFYIEEGPVKIYPYSNKTIIISA